MALFNFEPAEWAMFVFILASLSIFTGSIGAYSEHAPTWSLAQIVEWPFTNIILPVFNGPFPYLTLPIFILFVVWLTRVTGFVDPGLMGAIFFGVIVLTLHA